MSESGFDFKSMLNEYSGNKRCFEKSPHSFIYKNQQDFFIVIWNRAFLYTPTPSDHIE